MAVISADGAAGAACAFNSKGNKKQEVTKKTAEANLLSDLDLYKYIRCGLSSYLKRSQITKVFPDHIYTNK